MKELETEVKSLKGKLEELRKAKSTTLIKKEKEFVTTTLPSRESHSSHVAASNDSIKAKHQSEIEAVSTIHS